MRRRSCCCNMPSCIFSRSSPHERQRYAGPGSRVSLRSPATKPIIIRTSLRDLAAAAARALRDDRPRIMEGAGKAGSLPPPWPACRKESRRQSPQVRPKHPGLPCAMVLTLIRDLPGDRLSCPRRRHARHEHRRLDPSTGRSGPHDFTSASASFVRASTTLRANTSIASPPHVS